MRYRENKRTRDKVSEIGFGSAYIFEAGTSAAVETLRHAYEGGINYFDMAAGDGSAFPMYGEAFSDSSQTCTKCKSKVVALFGNIIA